jgi:phospholipase/carboxylesterase
MQLDARIDLDGINESVSIIHGLIETEKKRGIAVDKIILAGFSQGAVIALTTALSYPECLGGILALSGFLPFAENVLKNSSPANKNIPIFIGHGTQDNIVPYALGLATSEVLKKYGYPVKMHSYTMAHSVCAEEVNDIRNWLVKC